MKKINWLISDNTITVNYDGQTHMVNRSDGHADKLIEAIKSGDYDSVPAIVDAATTSERIFKWSF